MDADLDTLATALYVRIDDMLKDAPHRVPARPAGGFPPLLSDAELVTLSVMQALTGHTSEHRWLRFASARLRHLFGLPAGPARVQQAATQAHRHDRVADRRAGPGHHLVHR